MVTPKQKLTQLVADFRKWLSDNYSAEEINELNTDDAGYPNWEEITLYFSKLLDKKLISVLDDADQTNLLYLIARNWDIGSMIAWLSNTTNFSNCGYLDYKDFLMLARTLTKLEHQEFNDAKSQFVVAFKKLNELNSDAEEILLKFYNLENEYIKRQALITLGELGYKDIQKLVEKSWEINDEYQKVGCLFVINEYIKDQKLMKHYLQLAEKIESEYLKLFIEEITSTSK